MAQRRNSNKAFRGDSQITHAVERSDESVRFIDFGAQVGVGLTIVMLMVWNL